MTSVYIIKLGLKVQPTDVGEQKIDNSIFEIFKIVPASFQVGNKLGQSRFFQENLLLTNTSVVVILSMLFLTLINVEILFTK